MSTLTNYLTKIADALREKKGTEGVIPAQDYAEEIRKLKTVEIAEGSGGTVYLSNGTSYGIDKTDAIYQNDDNPITKISEFSIGETQLSARDYCELSDGTILIGLWGGLNSEYPTHLLHVTQNGEQISEIDLGDIGILNFMQSDSNDNVLIVTPRSIYSIKPDVGIVNNVTSATNDFERYVVSGSRLYAYISRTSDSGFASTIPEIDKDGIYSMDFDFSNIEYEDEWSTYFFVGSDGCKYYYGYQKNQKRIGDTVIWEVSHDSWIYNKELTYNPINNAAYVPMGIIEDKLLTFFSDGSYNEKTLDSNATITVDGAGNMYISGYKIGSVSSTREVCQYRSSSLTQSAMITVTTGVSNAPYRCISDDYALVYSYTSNNILKFSTNISLSKYLITPKEG